MTTPQQQLANYQLFTDTVLDAKLTFADSWESMTTDAQRAATWYLLKSDVGHELLVNCENLPNIIADCFFANNEDTAQMPFIKALMNDVGWRVNKLFFNQ